MSTTLKNKPDKLAAFRLLLEFLKEFELLYNLSPELNSKEVEQIYTRFLKITSSNI